MGRYIYFEMFGYVSLDKPELKIKDYQAFKSYYCGLCKVLKTEYGNMARLMLNYECAFLYLLIAAATGGKAEVKLEKCVVNPVKRKPVSYDAGAQYAAAVNVLLGVNKLRDAAKDDKNLLAALAAGGVYARAYKKAALKFPEVAQTVEKHLGELSQIEQERVADIDRPADAFGGLLGDIFENAPVDQNKKVLYNMGYNMGRWIYLIDAYDDMEKDKKSGNYNPFLLKNLDEKSLKEVVEFNLSCSVEQAARAYELLTIEKYGDILDNIMYSGLYKKTQALQKVKGEIQRADGSV